VPAAVLQIGERIRAERVRRGISLRGLARGVGVSASLISQIETGKCQPSVSTLYAITTVLGVSVQDVFGETRATEGRVVAGRMPIARAAAGPVAAGQGVAGQAALGQSAAGQSAAGQVAAGQVAAGQAVPAAPLSAAGPGEPAERAEPAGPVVCPGQREVLELDSGVTWQRLGLVPGSRVDFLLVSYPPGGCSSPEGHLMQHAGTEYGYLIQGELVVTLGLRSHRLAPGDAVSFASATPHSYRNGGTVPAVGIWFVAESGGP
jgi:transcriptional regulator with XRE-family HTH domain/quercetin dioxygenase-like cupin family protein